MVGGIGGMAEGPGRGNGGAGPGPIVAGIAIMSVMVERARGPQRVCCRQSVVGCKVNDTCSMCGMRGSATAHNMRSFRRLGVRSQCQPYRAAVGDIVGHRSLSLDGVGGAG